MLLSWILLCSVVGIYTINDNQSVAIHTTKTTKILRSQINKLNLKQFQGSLQGKLSDKGKM